MKVAIYARYSSDNQRDASIADQLRVCRLHAEKQGWQVVEEYTDHAISGASPSSRYPGSDIGCYPRSLRLRARGGHGSPIARSGRHRRPQRSA